MDALDQFLDGQGGSGIDAFLDAKPPEVKKEPEAHGTAATGIENFAQGITFNTADEIDAGITAAKRALIDGKDLKSEYANKLKYNRANLRRDAAAHPVAAAGGQISGGVTGAFALPVGGAATTLGRLAQGTGMGAVTGAASGAGDAEGDAIDRVMGAVKGAVYGGAGGLAGSTLGELARKGVQVIRGAPKVVAKTSEDLTGEYLAGREALKAVELPAEIVKKELVDKATDALKYENAGRYGPEVRDMMDELKTFGRTGVNANYLESFRQDLSQLPSKFSEPLRKVMDDFYEAADLPTEFRAAYKLKRQGEILGDALTKAGDSLTKQRNAINNFLTKQKGLSEPVIATLKEAGKASTPEKLLGKAASVLNMAGILNLGVRGSVGGAAAAGGAAGLREGTSRIASQQIENALEAVKTGGASVPATQSKVPGAFAKVGAAAATGLDQSKPEKAPERIRIQLAPKNMNSGNWRERGHQYVRRQAHHRRERRQEGCTAHRPRDWTCSVQRVRAGAVHHEHMAQPGRKEKARMG